MPHLDTGIDCPYSGYDIGIDNPNTTNFDLWHSCSPGSYNGNADATPLTSIKFNPYSFTLEMQQTWVCNHDNGQSGQ